MSKAIKLAVVGGFMLGLVSCAPIRFGAPLVDTAVQGQQLAPGSLTTLTASCPASEPLMGGGFTVIHYSSEDPVTVLASYPSGQDWKVQIRSNSQVEVIANAYCYARQQSAPITVKVITANQSFVAQQWHATAICPSGSVLIGGGYQSVHELPNDVLVNGGILGSFPSIASDGSQTWIVEVGDYILESREVNSFALCATGSLKSLGIASAAYSPPTISPFQGGDLVAPCPGSSFTTGAGFLLGNGNLQIPHPVSALYPEGQFTGGHLTFGPQYVNPPPAAYASCLSIPE